MKHKEMDSLIPLGFHNWKLVAQHKCALFRRLHIFIGGKCLCPIYWGEVPLSGLQQW